MRNCLVTLGLLLCLSVSCRSSGPAQPSPAVIPTPAATHTPAPVPTPVINATPTPTSPLPPEDTPPPLTPDLPPEEIELRQLLGEEGFALAVPPGQDLLNWAAADLDGDGQDEVVVRTCPGDCDQSGNWSLGQFRILQSADGAYSVDADLEVDSTFNFWPDFAVMQVRPDGGLGIVEQSACGAHSLCLNLYTWDGAEYRMFPFSGSAMGAQVNPDGTVAVGNRDYFTDPLSNGWTGVYRWRGSDYTLETVTFEGPDYKGPVGAVLAYYNTINICVYDESFQPAYAYLSRGFQADQPYIDFQAGFADTLRVTVEDLILVAEHSDSAKVTAVITATDEVNGAEEAARYDITWYLTQEDGVWKLDQAQVQAR